MPSRKRKGERENKRVPKPETGGCLRKFTETEMPSRRLEGERENKKVPKPETGGCLGKFTEITMPSRKFKRERKNKKAPKPKGLGLLTRVCAGWIVEVARASSSGCEAQAHFETKVLGVA